MTPESRLKLRQLLVKHEAMKLHVYADSVGKLTIGVGRNLTDRGISEVEALYLLDDDMAYFYDKLLHFLPWFSNLSENRQIALCDMCFNLGVQGFLNFHDTLAALEAGNYALAAEHMLASKWHEQVGERAACLANIIRTGELP